jgi:DNA (cytosine-5)-methyltransferase 1
MATHAQVQPTVPILSLFSGCGGFDLGFANAGFEVALALDIDPSAVETYNHNHKGNRAEVCDLSATCGEDVIKRLDKKQLSAPPRGVIGGSPCQSFSSSNVHLKAGDIRHTLPRKYAAILKTLNQHYKLDFFVFENVRGITSQKHLETFGEFKQLFSDAGFSISEGLLDAIKFGVPQRRPRVFVVGFNLARYGDAKFYFPSGSSQQSSTSSSVASVLRGLKEPEFFQRDLNARKFPEHPNHWTMQPKSAKFRDGFLKEGQNRGRSFRVLSWNKPSWTVAYGNREIHIHPSGTRRLSVYEAMLLQGFPKNYVLKGNLSEQIRQVSDTVPWQVGEALATAIRRFMLEHQSPIRVRSTSRRGGR